MSTDRRIPILISCLLLPFVISAPAAAAPNEASVSQRRAAVPSEPERVRWRVQLDGDYSLHSPGVGAEGTIYAAMAHGQLYAIRSDGTVKWVVQAGLGGGAWGPVSIGHDGTVHVAGMVPAGDGYSYVVETKTRR